MTDKAVRGLTSSEAEHVPAPIAETIDLRRVKIISRPWTLLTSRRITVARGYRLYWPGAPIEARRPAEIAHLIHELTHVWQYNYLGVGMYSLRWLDRRYGYVLTEGDSFAQFGLEQQASIVEDYTLSLFGLPLRRAENKPSPQLLRGTVMGMTAA